VFAFVFGVGARDLTSPACTGQPTWLAWSCSTKGKQFGPPVILTLGSVNIGILYGWLQTQQEQKLGKLAICNGLFTLGPPGPGPSELAASVAKANLAQCFLVLFRTMDVGSFCVATVASEVESGS